MPVDPLIQNQFPILGNITHAEVAANPALAAAIPAFYRLNLPYDPPQVVIHEELIPDPKGAFRLRIYQPAPAAQPRPALVWVHSGGFTAGSIDMPEADLVSREVCARARWSH